MHEDGKQNPDERDLIDFDHDSAEHALHWPDRYRNMRSACPRGWASAHGGFWVATRYEDVLAIAQRKESFATGKSFDPETGEARGGVTIPPLPFRVAPNEVDFPEWQGVRSFLNRHFSPKAVEKRQQRAAQFAAALVNEVIETGRLDIVDSLASPLPSLMTMEIIGFPLDRWELFADAFHKIIYLPKESPEHARALRSTVEMDALIAEETQKRRTDPREDLLSHLVHGTIDGEPIGYARLREIVYNVLGGGVDTTTALTSNALLYLSRRPDERRRLIDDPALLPLACEEFVRYFSPIQGLARTASEDVSIGDWKIAKGDRVILTYASANRDAEIFEDPETLKLDRYPNRHVGFGAGMHRCMGSFLARMMFRAMMSEVLNRLPDYRVDEGGIVPYTSISTVNGWISIPASFTPGPKVGPSLKAILGGQR